jgi:hypothetical protein
MTTTTTFDHDLDDSPEPAGAAGLDETRVEALFASNLQRSEPVTPESVRDAVTNTVSRLGTRGCAAQMAQEFGEHPEAAVGRMRWALGAVRQAYPREPGPDMGRPRVRLVR